MILTQVSAVQSINILSEEEECEYCISNIPRVENPVQDTCTSTHVSRRNNDSEDSKSMYISYPI